MGPTRTSPNLLKIKLLVERAFVLREVPDRFRRLRLTCGLVRRDAFIIKCPKLQGEVAHFGSNLRRDFWHA